MRIGVLIIILTLMVVKGTVHAQDASSQPNIILIFCDDLGYGDLSSYGSVWNQTPEIDQMAAEGVRFTNFYAGAPVCTPSRAGLMTGSYSRRVDMDLDAKNRWVLFPVGKKGINPDEITLPELLKGAGYATAIIGKWHLGDQPAFLPTRNGFDYWFGLPYSNDMENVKRGDPPLPLMRNEQVAEQLQEHKKFDQSTLTKRYTEEAISWIGANKEQPFFLYLPHTMPHNPVAARDQFMDKTNNPKKGFGASVAEISWSTGALLNYLKREQLDENTLVIFTSDNGGNPVHGASNGILKGRKGQTLEGGVRVPCIARWPGKIEPGGTSHAPASVIDFYATFGALAKARIDPSIKRDGKDISDHLFNPQRLQPDRPYFYWHVGYLRAVRYGDWKIHLTGKFSKEKDSEISLYNLKNDPGELKNIADKNPKIIKQLLALAEREKSALGEFENYGPEVRKTIQIAEPKPLVK
jgi:arylsulfatase A-like enzyme